MKILKLLEDAKSDSRHMLRIQSELIDRLPEECEIEVKMPNKFVIIDANKNDYELFVVDFDSEDYSFECKEYLSLKNIIIDTQYLIVANILRQKCGFKEDIEEFEHNSGGTAIVEKTYHVLDKTLTSLKFTSDTVGLPKFQTEKHYHNSKYPDVKVCVYCFEEKEYSISIIKSNQ